MKLSHLARWTLVAVLPLAALAPLPERRTAEGRAVDTPVADNDAAYTVCGRVFPDPQAYWPSPAAAAGESPWAKGNSVCRAQDFIQYDEAVSGMKYLATKFPDFVEVYDLSQDFDSVLDRELGEGLSAGVPLTTMQREKSPLYLFRVTDETVPEKDKKHFVFPLSIHGIERAGVEGGLRAAEDLATWGANAPDQPVMETDPDTSLPVGEILKKSSVYFVLANPDGWRRGDTAETNYFYMRYNGNGVDMNRDWPAIGYTFRPYTPWSEPETRSFGKVLKAIRPKWDGGIDLHGQLADRAFSFTLLGASQRPFDKNQRVLQFTKGAWADAEKRLAWNPLIKPNSEPPACAFVEDPTEDECDETNRIYGVQWGTIWDTIAYTVTGAFGDWIDSPIGLDADGIDNEMSLSHLSNCGVGKCFIHSAEQLHVDGNKSLIYAMLNYSHQPEDTTFKYEGKVAYVNHGKRRVNAGRVLPTPPAGLDAQEDITTTLAHDGSGATVHEFDVKGSADGVYNGGLSAIVTYTNAEGVSPGATLTVRIEREVDGEWVVVNEDFNQSSIYLQAGMKVDANLPQPGHYRVTLTGGAVVAVDLTLDFTRGLAWPDPGQRPYDVSNIDFFEELKPFVASPDQLTEITPAGIRGGVNLKSFDTIVVPDLAWDKALAARFKAFVQGGGNLVLTDGAVKGLEDMGVVPAGSVEETTVYAGYAEFQHESEGTMATTYDDPLAVGVQQPGAAEGPNHRHQITEPVPTGYAIQDEDGSDTATMPQWTVSTEEWEAAGGRSVGHIGQASVTLGEMSLGRGRIRILGTLLPMPTEEFDHPYGLSDYALTYSGYELARNLLSWKNPGGTAPIVNPPVQKPPVQKPPVNRPPAKPLPSTGGDASWLSLLAVGAAAAVVVRRRRARVG